MRKISIHFTQLAFLTLMLIVCVGRESLAETSTLKDTPKTVIDASLKTTDKNRATVTAGRLNLRKEASVNSRILGVLEKGDLLEVISVTDNWLNVITPTKKVGWVYGLYVDSDVESKKKPMVSLNKDLKTLNKPAKDNIIEKDLVSEKPTQKPPQDLRKQLESVWSAYREAHRNGDKVLYKKSCSAHSYGTLVNTLAAVREELKPEDLTFFYDRMPDLATLKFVELKKNGPTVGILYVDEDQKRPDPKLPPPKRFLFIKFVQEAWGWTVDGGHSTSMPKYQIDDSESQFDHASLPEKLAIDGKVLPAPKELKKLKVRIVKGSLDISSYGYKTKVSINSFPQGKAENNDFSRTVAGGLKKGLNKIEIVIARSDNTEANLPPKVTVQYLSNGGTQKEAFSYNPTDNFDGRHLFTFMIE